MKSEENIIRDMFVDQDYDSINNLVRWNGLPRIKDETVGHHTFMVIWFGRILIEYIIPPDDTVNKLNILDGLIYHDFDEFLTGDILHQVKNNLHNGKELRVILDEYITHEIDKKFSSSTKFDKFMSSKLSKFSLSKSNKDIVKLADWLSAMFYIKKEISLGNKMLYETYVKCNEKMKLLCETILQDVTNNEYYDYSIIKDIRNTDFLNILKTQ